MEKPILVEFKPAKQLSWWIIIPWCWASWVLSAILISLALSSCSPEVSKHQNDSVADRLRQRHAPMKLHNPSLK